MKDKNDYAEMGLRALRRAAKKVYEEACKKNIKTLTWKNWQEYIDPKNRNHI